MKTKCKNGMRAILKLAMLSTIIFSVVSCSTESINEDETTKLTATAAKAKKAVERPFKIKEVTGTYSIFQSDPEVCAALTLNAPGEGTATHLGRIIFMEEWCWNGLADDLGTRSLKLIAANGDELWGTHNYVEFTSETTFIEVLEFNGGTGRFEHATGEFMESVVINPEDPFSGTFSMSGSGTITY